MKTSFLKRHDAFSLVELIVVIGIISILLAVSTMNFSQWVSKSQIEKQTREVLADFNSARTEAMFRKKVHSIAFNGTGNGYVFKRYSSENENTLTGGTAVETKKFTHSISTESGSTIPDNTTLVFDTRGFALSPRTIRIDPVNSGAAYDCIVIAPSRTNIGQMSGGSCVQK